MDEEEQAHDEMVQLFHVLRKGERQHAASSPDDDDSGNDLHLSLPHALCWLSSLGYSSEEVRASGENT